VDIGVATVCVAVGPRGRRGPGRRDPRGRLSVGMVLGGEASMGMPVRRPSEGEYPHFRGTVSTAPFRVRPVGREPGKRAVYTPALQQLFGTTAMTAGEWALAIATAALGVLTAETEKLIHRHRARHT
jgi:hypothetical protein